MKLDSIFAVCLTVFTGIAGLGFQSKSIEAAAFVLELENPAEEVKSTIKKMIALIDERKTVELLEKYTDIPSEKRKEIAEQIDQDKLDELKMYLGKAAKLMPKVSDDGKTVVFENDEFPRPMKFVKSGDKWLMKDK